MNTFVRNTTRSVVLCGMLLSMLPAHISFAQGRKHTQEKRKTVDYIVIGSCAGAVVAKKLTDDKETSVLLLEAGDDNNTDAAFVSSSDAPRLPIEHNIESVFQGTSTLQEQLNNGYYDFMNARILGGGSSINAEQVVFGSSAYWTRVQNDALGGNEEWSPTKVFKRYKALENYKNTADPVVTPSASRGSCGPWKNAAVPSVLSDNAQYLLGALTSISNLPEIQDYNDPATPVGAFARWDMQQNFDDAAFPRVSAATAFLGSDVVNSEGCGVKGRKLKVLVRATALSLIWDEECSTKVIGVRYSQDGECHEVYVKKEVILAAGFLTAPFLQRNGIGPVDVLQNAGVEVRVVNDHVGQHVVNHVGVPVIFSTPGGALLQTDGQPNAFLAPGAFLPVKLPANPNVTNVREIQWNIMDLQPYGSGDFIEVLPMLLSPVSEGTVSIQNDDPFKIPAFNTNYLNDGANLDINALVSTLQTSVGALADFFANNQPTAGGANWVLVAPTRAIISDSPALVQYIKENLVQAYDFTSSARMGTDAGSGVVDAHGRVFGVKGLRLADASILPFIPDGGTCSPSILVGWTIANFIKAENK